MRSLVVATALLAAPAFGETPQLAVAPAGVCAGEEPDLVVRLTASDEDEPSLARLLTPTNVAAAAPRVVLPPPAPPLFAGPGACDDPGSGCLPRTVVDDPNPGTGCGFPGSACE